MIFLKPALYFDQ